MQSCVGCMTNKICTALQAWIFEPLPVIEAGSPELTWRTSVVSVKLRMSQKPKMACTRSPGIIGSIAPPLRMFLAITCIVQRCVLNDCMCCQATCQDLPSSRVVEHCSDLEGLPD